MKVDARVQKSQQAIISTALTLFNQNRDVTFSEIASQAGVGRATLYRQFETREVLIKAIALTCFNRLDSVNDIIEEEAKSAIHAIELCFHYVMPFTEEFKFLAEVEHLIEDDPDIIRIYKQQFDETIALVQQAKKEGSIRKSLPNAWLATLIEGLFFTAWEAISEHGMSPEETATLAFDSLCNGIK